MPGTVTWCYGGALLTSDSAKQSPQSHPHMLTRKSLLVLPLLSAALALGVHAQQQESSSQGQPSQPPSGQTAKEATKQELKIDEQEAKKEVTDANKASKVIGMKVKNAQNEDLGTIKDFAVDLQSGKIAYVVLSAGSTLGIGGSLVAVPAESLTPMQGEKGFLLKADKNRLSDAPGFDEKNWPTMDAAQESSVGLTPTGRSSQGEQEKQKE